MNLPGWISLSRVLMAAFLSAAILNHHYLWVVPGIIFCAVTDILDGFVARMLNIMSEKGRYLDRLCDQILELFLVLSYYVAGHLPRWYFMVVLFRCLFQIGTSPFLFKSLVRYELEKLYRRDKIGSAMTLVVIFFLSFALGLKEEAAPLSKGLTEIALPYVLIPLSGTLEFLNLYMQSTRLSRFFKNDVE